MSPSSPEQEVILLAVRVRRKDILQMRDLFVSRGFRLPHAFTKRQEDAYLSRTCEFTVHGGDGRSRFDSHGRMAADYLAASPDVEGLLDRRVEGSLLGCLVPSLAAEDTLLYLCLHGTFHMWDRLAPVCDMAMLVESRKDRDWPRLSERAERAGLWRTLLLGLTLAGDLLSISLPPAIQEAADRDRTLGMLRAQVRARLLRGGIGQNGFHETALFHVRSKERLSDKVRYRLIRSLIPTVEDWRRIRLPDPRFFLYCFLRPLRLVREGIFPVGPPGSA